MIDKVRNTLGIVTKGVINDIHCYYLAGFFTSRYDIAIQVIGFRKKTSE